MSFTCKNTWKFCVLYLLLNGSFKIGLIIYVLRSEKNENMWCKCVVLFPQSMVHPNPSCRPSALAITHHPALCPQAQKSRAQLRKELNEERLKNEVLSR